MIIAPLPAGPFDVLMADPAWAFKTWSKKGEGKSPQKHYDCMSLDDICAIPVADVAAADAALFIWCTWPMIFDAKRVIEAWGFKYSGLAWEWIKWSPTTLKYSFGGGYGTRKNVEPCLLAKRGSPKLLSRSERDYLFAPRREHGRKPDEQYDRIERMYQGRKLELFARTQRPGWDAWGNQSDLFPPAESVPTLSAAQQLDLMDAGT